MITPATTLKKLPKRKSKILRRALITDQLAQVLYSAAKGEIQMPPKKQDPWKIAFSTMIPEIRSKLVLEASAWVTALSRTSGYEQQVLKTTKDDELKGTFLLFVATEMLVDRNDLYHDHARDFEFDFV